jgi:hypothetical protein
MILPGSRICLSQITDPNSISDYGVILKAKNIGFESDPEPDNDEAVERARINSETAKIAWNELQRFFAQGHAIFVAPDLDLVDVAWEISCNQKAPLEAWMADSKVGQVSDAQALEWLEADALMWCVVIRPWVLVQPVPDSVNG